MAIADQRPSRVATAPQRTPSAWKPFLLRQLVQWHWISAAIALVGIVLFSLTGITLNHASDIKTDPIVQERTALLPQTLRDAIAAAPQTERQQLPPAVSAWIEQKLSVVSAGRDAEWSDEEIYLALARPGGDAWISIDRGSGEVTHEDTWRGGIAYFNDLHKGRNTGAYWAWFIDIFAGACVIFCLTGLGLLWLKAAARPSTWPLIGLGIVIPLLLALFFIH